MGVKDIYTERYLRAINLSKQFQFCNKIKATVLPEHRNENVASWEKEFETYSKDKNVLKRNEKYLANCHREGEYERRLLYIFSRDYSVEMNAEIRSLIVHDWRDILKDIYDKSKFFLSTHEVYKYICNIEARIPEDHNHALIFDKNTSVVKNLMSDIHGNYWWFNRKTSEMWRVPND